MSLSGYHEKNAKQKQADKKKTTKKPPTPTKTTKPQTVDHTGMLCYSLIMSRY